MTEDQRKFIEQQKLQRIAPPIYLETQSLTEEGIKALEKDFQESLLKVLESSEKIPYSPEGWKTLEKMFKESYERIISKTHVTIDIYIEK